MKKLSTVFIVCLIALAARVLLFPAAALGEGETTPRPKPTVRPLAVRYDYRLPGTRLTVENVLNYFSVELGKEYSRGKHLIVPYTVSAREAYDKYDGTTPGVYIRLQLSVFLAENDTEPYLTKTYIVMLRRKTGLTASGVIEVFLKLDQDDVWYTWEVIGCNGRVGLAEGPD